MDQAKEYINPIKPPIRANKYLVYKEKKYPIDFSFFKKYSNFFYENKDKFKSTKDIELQLDNYEVTEDTILMFIACCQNEPFEITDANAFSLYQLSIQYKVSELNNLTSIYINKNKKTLIFQSILYKIQNQNSMVNFDLSNEEKIIASNFFEFINDDKLTSLPISVLYRIINDKVLNLKTMDTTHQTQLFEFLFKCLDKYKKPGSVLFLNIDLETERIDLLIRLLRDYSSIFDFNLINPKLLANNASYLLNELNKLKIEYSQKCSDIEAENQKQKELFESLVKSFNDSKNELVQSNNLLKERIESLEREQNNKLIQLEEKLNEQAKKLERYTNIKVKSIKIITDSKFLFPGSKVTLTAEVQPEFAFIDGVEWKIVQEVEGTVEIESKNNKKLVLKCLQRKKVTIIASSMDGSEVSESIELVSVFLKGTIEISVQQNQVIKGIIKVTEEEESKLDKSKSKFILNSNSSPNLERNEFESGLALDSLIKEVSFAKQRGTYYLHVLMVDKSGFSKEIISQAITTNGVPPICFNSTGKVQSVELAAGSYKLEAWGAQGGATYSYYGKNFQGGKGGYSVGTIHLKKCTLLYINVGCQGGKSIAKRQSGGGYNGGGAGYYHESGNENDRYVGGGGGSTDIRINEDSLYSRVIVAGGGGAAGYNQPEIPGGFGGGNCGESKQTHSIPERRSNGGTQIAGGSSTHKSAESGSFGQGGNGIGDWVAGGGGGWYGGSACYCGHASGGSGWIYTESTFNKWKEGNQTDSSKWLLNSEYYLSDAKTIGGDQEIPSHDGKSQTQGNSGNGYAQITPL